jgi:kynurenine 3-monooxygenase
MEKVVIVGAGPAGLLLAHALQQRGRYAIELYERRPDPREAPPSQERTFPISLQIRGLEAIRTIPGLEAAIAAKGIWAQGACLHRRRGQPRTVERKTPQLIIDRHALSRGLTEALWHGDRAGAVAVHYHCTGRDIDPVQQRITLEPIARDPFTVHYDRLIAADGVNSHVRAALVQRAALQCEKSTAPDAYKPVCLQRVSDDGTIALADNRIHTWTLGQGMRVVTAPQAGNRLQGVLIFPQEHDPLATMPSATAVLDCCRQSSATLAALMTLKKRRR